MLRSHRIGAAAMLLLSGLLGGCGSGDSHNPSNALAPPKALAPSIGMQPQNQTVTAGQPATFTVTASGTAPLSYQWMDDGSSISGATTSTYTTSATTAAQTGSQFTVVVTNAAGSATSTVATLTVNTAPSITTQPANQSVVAGQVATFTVSASGTAPLTYQWMDNGSSISGATGAAYTTTATTAAQSGAQLTVVVSNSAGSATSNAATLTVIAPPAITDQPDNQTVAEGAAATFTVSASGAGPLTYQWLENGNSISGATSPAYTTPPTTGAQTGEQFTVAVSNTAGTVTSNPVTLTVLEKSQSIKTVFIILMENKDWSYITSYNNAPYINHTLVPMGAHALQYYNPAANHPTSYLWFEAGTNYGINNYGPPSQDHQSTTQHLVTLLKNAGISWKAYDEDISGTVCPLTDVNQYAVDHNPFVYYDDVTDDLNPNSAYCIAHVRPFTELAGDLQANTVASYNFITPNNCDNMHNAPGVGCGIPRGDAWLSENVPLILNSAAYQQGGVLFITWDEGTTLDVGPIGMVVLSPFAKRGYSNSLYYDHGSTLRTIEEIFHVTPILGDAVNQRDLSDLFTSFP